MKKLLLLGVLGIFVFSLSAFANQPPVPNAPIAMDKTKQPVTFNHATHTAYECESCHHPVDGVATYKLCSDAGCHDAMGGAKAKGVDSYYQIAHKTKGTKYSTCISCHADFVKTEKDRKKELTSCKGSACHA